MSLKSCLLPLLSGAMLVIGCSTTSPDAPRGVEHYVQGVSAYTAGDTARAQQSLETAVRANPDLTMARSLLGDLYRNRGEYQKAIDQYNRLTQLDPYYGENYYRLGVSYQLINKLKEAATNYGKALQLNPEDARSNMALGVVYITEGDSAKALPYLEKSVQLDPANADAWFNLATALDAAGQYARAEVAYRKSLELKTGRPEVLMNYGTNLILQGRGREAISVLQEAVKTSDTAMSRKRLGDAYAFVDQHEDALREYQGALKLNASYFPAMNEAGAVYIAMYRKGLELDDTLRQRAIKSWKRSLEINSQQPRVSELLKRWENPKLFTP